MNLVSLDGKGKVRIVSITMNWDMNVNGYIIHRQTGQLNGKLTIQPEIIIDKGKAKRTVKEQANLMFNSHIKKYKDKGYKEWNDNFNEAAIKEFLGDIKTGSDGVLKPMLAKQADKVAIKFFDGDFMASRKINGVRALIFYKDGVIHTASRGSINYDLALYHIINNPILIKFFENHPTAILDGEIYKFGKTLNYISGLVRHQDTVDATKDLEFYWYDVVDTETPFSARWELMQEWAKELQLHEFNPEYEFSDEELKIQLLPQVSITGWHFIKNLHDKWVSEGWEGLVIRKLTATYGPGKRSNDMIKVKEYTDAEYQIVGLAEGLRDEDMCFVMCTEDGQEFKAKPIGNRTQKQWYRDNIDNIIGKMGTIKYFEMSGKEGSKIPQQPIFICIRDYE